MKKTKPIRAYEVVALKIPVVYNKYGYHDRNGMVFALKKNVSRLKEIQHHFAERDKNHNYYHADLHKPHPLARPLVIRARKGETVKISLQNEIQGRKVGLHLVSDGYSVLNSDGAHVGNNPASLVSPSTSDNPISYDYYWECRHEGVFVFHDMGDVNGDQDASNAHGLFGALVVEPEDAEWTDSETGDFADDGLYVDVHPKGRNYAKKQSKKGWLEKWRGYYAEDDASFREYVVFIHDEGDVKKPGGWWVKDPKNPAQYKFEDDPKIPLDGKGSESKTHPGLPKDLCAVELGCKPGDEDEEGLTPCKCAHVKSHHPAPNDHDGEHEPKDQAHNNDMPAHVMPLSYRSEPMDAREMVLWHRIWKNEKLPCPNIVNEEQHHSSWAFGDPDTPILKAYIGDPVRIRLVHAGVKETHIFHLHFYQWHHVPYNKKTPILDSITISPQTGHTIVPLWGAGGPHGVTADVIWHCHLYPHFHHGMWGLFRTFDRLHLTEPSQQHDLTDFSNHYPDGSPINKLQPLPDRQPPLAATRTNPGFPGFMVDPDAHNKTCENRGGIFSEKSPLPPWPYAVSPEHAAVIKTTLGLNTIVKPIPLDMDYRPATNPELVQMYQHQDKGNKFNTQPEPAWVFPTFAPERDPKGRKLKRKWFNLAVKTGRVVYNSHGYHDDYGHFYINEGWGDGNHPNEFNQAIDPPGIGRCECPQTKIPPGPSSGCHDHAEYQQDEQSHTCDNEDHRPLFIRANKGDLVTLTLWNDLPKRFGCTDFDMRQPRCDTLGTPTAECGLHVHLVKFDVLTADGASSGWNYMSGPTPGKRMIYKWQVDEEFGACFFHDHCFANYRQRHGLFGALIAEPKDAKVFDPSDRDRVKEIRHGITGVVSYPNSKGELQWFREFCFGLQDFVPLYTQDKHPLHKPELPGHDGDNGWMAMNYRCEPLMERKPSGEKFADPAEWFSSKTLPEPSTDIFLTYPGEPIRLRLVQGSHEEQHSFQVHGMRWRRFRNEPDSPWQNQQTLGISEAFTFNIAHKDALNPYYGPGDYLWKSTASDDLWCGVWGYIHALAKPDSALPLLPSPKQQKQLKPPPLEKRRRFKIQVCQQQLVYRPTHQDSQKLVDPNGLLYKLTEITEPGGKTIHINSFSEVEPLVIRCRVGEWVEVELYNNLPKEGWGKAGLIVPEPWSPLSPEEAITEDDDEEAADISPEVKRKVSKKVSLHADLLSYDIKTSDGSNVGQNPDQCIAPGESKTYLWYADVEGPVLLQDMADIKNHRHHGLVGALVVEPKGSTPLNVKTGETAATCTESAWYGSRATLRLQDGSVQEEKVLLLQDGLRLFWEGNDLEQTYQNPMRDLPADPNEKAPDFEDQGNKAINYRCEPLGHFLIPGRGEIPTSGVIQHLDPTNAEPLMTVPQTADVMLHVVGACDKGRNHAFTVHAHAWEEWPGVKHSPMLGAIGGISGGSKFMLDLKATHLEAADYAVRSGVYSWALNEGLWGILRRK